MRVFPQELLIMRLRNKLPRALRYDWARNMSIEEVLDKLKLLAGEDLGTDPDVWAKWWKAEKKRLDIDPQF